MSLCARGKQAIERASQQQTSSPADHERVLAATASILISRRAHQRKRQSSALQAASNGLQPQLRRCNQQRAADASAQLPLQTRPQEGSPQSVSHGGHGWSGAGDISAAVNNQARLCQRAAPFASQRVRVLLEHLHADTCSQPSFRPLLSATDAAAGQSERGMGCCQLSRSCLSWAMWSNAAAQG
jgi:hypothetical protein